MNEDRQRLEGLVRTLIQQPHETVWLEFKVGNSDPEKIGQTISALSNAATLVNRKSAYIVWGVRDQDHAIVGTGFRPNSKAKGNESFEPWLSRQLRPAPLLKFGQIAIDGHQVVVLELTAATRQPVRFGETEYIRIGPHNHKLRDHPESERSLWARCSHSSFEAEVAHQHLSLDEVLRLVDYPSYFDMLGVALPSTPTGIAESLQADALIQQHDSGDWEVSNLGAVLFAKDLDQFPGLRRKAVRVISYAGSSRVTEQRELGLSGRGYAAGFRELMQGIDNLVPRNEVIGKAFRTDEPMYPDSAIRELVANALIHQDFSQRGTGPMIEVFQDRMEITNPGLPLVDSDRLIDSPPKSPNEGLASLMRRVGICEERGTGWDKIAFAIEVAQLPAPLIELTKDHTRITLFGHQPLKRMDRDAKIRAVYLHACLRYVSGGGVTTNSSIRERFGISKGNSALATRLLNLTLDAKRIRPRDDSKSRKHSSYLPFWA